MLLGELPLTAGRRRVGPGVVFGELPQGTGPFAAREPLLHSFAKAAGLPEGDTRTVLAKFDLAAIEELEAALEDYEGTTLLVTHDRRFLERFCPTQTVALF